VQGRNQHSGIGCASHARHFGNHPLIIRHICVRKSNRRGCHKRSWAWSRWDASLWFADKWRPSPDVEELEFQGVGRQLAAMRQPPSRFGSGVSTSRDGWLYSVELELDNLPAGCESLGIRRTRVNYGEQKNPPKPHVIP
jgi:hypothetical protein